MQEFPVLLYTAPEGAVKVNAVLKDETLWMTQGAMSELFGVQKAAISKHLKNIFESGELVDGVVVSKMETTTPHGAIAGKTQEHAVNFYNLDAIIYAITGETAAEDEGICRKCERLSVLRAVQDTCRARQRHTRGRRCTGGGGGEMIVLTRRSQRDLMRSAQRHLANLCVSRLRVFCVESEKVRKNGRWVFGG